jgi:DNA-binding beta-propeller fold protein YncE
VAGEKPLAARPAAAGGQVAGGARLWVALYKGSNGNGQATAIAASPDGSKVFVTGLNGDSPPHEFYGTVAYNPDTGARLWTASYRGPAGDSSPAAIAVSWDGSTVFVTGSSAPRHASTTDYATVAYDAATGARRWTARYYGPAGDGQATAIAASPDGSKVFVTGSSATTTGGFAYATVAYDAATGARLWVARYTGSAATGVSSATSVAVSPDGSTVFVTGTVGPDLGVRGWATVAYAAATGARLWLARYSGPVNKGGFARSVAVSPDGSKAYVTGASAASASADLTAYATVAYDTVTGARLWVARYTGPAKESAAVQLVVSPDGSEVFVTGSAVKVFRNLGQYQYATVAYDAATGSRRWLRLYPDRARYSPGVGIAVSADGSKVFVTGTTAEPGFHYATVAYSS